MGPRRLNCRIEIVGRAVDKITRPQASPRLRTGPLRTIRGRKITRPQRRCRNRIGRVGLGEEAIEADDLTAARNGGGGGRIVSVSFLKSVIQSMIFLFFSLVSMPLVCKTGLVDNEHEWRLHVLFMAKIQEAVEFIS